MTQHSYIDVTAPVVPDTSLQSLQRLSGFMDTLIEHGNVAAAKAESVRLAPYFARMSALLDKELTKREDRAFCAEVVCNDPKIARLRKLISKENLAGLFNAMAVKTHHTILSEVAITSHHFFEIPDYAQQTYTYNGHKMIFGFLLMDHPDAKNDDNTSCALLTLPPDMIAAIAPYGGEAILRDLQTVMTLVNHDPVHQLSMPLLLNGKERQKFDINDAIMKWGDKISHYENFSQITHQRMMRVLKNDPQNEQLYTTLDAFFAKLGDAGRRIAEKGGHTAVSRKHAHEVVDFFGMAMGQALMRAFSLNDPVITHYCNQMYRADPFPELNNLQHRDKTLDDLQLDQKGKEGRLIWQILNSYKDCGLHILSSKDAVMSYKNHKLLQLISLSPADTAPLAPSMVNPDIGKIQQKYGKLLLKMVRAAAKTTGYEPQ